MNPAQFAPHEDLATYPRTLDSDLKLLESTMVSVTAPSGGTIERTPSAVFAPTVGEMYPSGINQDVGVQKGTFIEVKGYSHQMEGGSRPTFFRGVATVRNILSEPIHRAESLRSLGRNKVIQCCSGKSFLTTALITKFIALTY